MLVAEVLGEPVGGFIEEGKLEEDRVPGEFVVQGCSADGTVPGDPPGVTQHVF